MNTTQAKKIPLQEILAKLGLQPVKTFKSGAELAYHSPFREEKEPSLFVNTHKNVWNDFGDIGGNALDFVIRYQNTDVKGALSFLEQIFGYGFVPPPVKPVKVERTETIHNENTFLLASIAPFGANKNSLFDYITVDRKIDPLIAAQYLKEVRFSNRENGKKYFAVGFSNLSGGFEIRNPYFKSSIGTKDMSFVKGNGTGTEVWIFEGFMDFLSKLTQDHSEVPPADCLILNSVSYFEKAVHVVRSSGYKIAKSFLDNDRAGDDTTLKFKAEFGDAFFDKRSEYQEFKDLNEYLKHTPK
jgi:hypothetical protein